MMLVLIASPRQPLIPELLRALGEARLASPEDFCASASSLQETNCVYLPAAASSDGTLPDLGEAQRVLQRAAQIPIKQFVLLSSALVYGIGSNRHAMVEEDYSLPGSESQEICRQWRSLESLAATLLGESALAILRPCPIAALSAFPAQTLSRRLAVTLPGHDPVFQFLSVPDLAGAVLAVVEQGARSTFNVAPESVVPLRRAVRILRNTRLPFPRTLQRLTRRTESLEHLRYPWTISGRKMERELGFVPHQSSAAALTQMQTAEIPAEEQPSPFDLFGMDKDYIRIYGKTLFRFLSDFYWRIEDRGAEYIPAEGRALLVGMHRGFMPLDGVMALHTVVRKTGRYPRFMTHPALLKFPFLANFMTKLGGVVACQESADLVLESNELLGIFPEGIHGAFTRYRDAYKLQAFGRDAFVKLALRHRAPIVPFVTVGSAEIYPILGKIKSRRWTRYSGWPFIPITPTFPLIPAPLPSKWHTQFLPPISTKQYGPGAAEDRVIVRDISREVRQRMQQAVNEMIARRQSIFWGTIFGSETQKSEGTNAAAWDGSSSRPT
jgi:1-acyl-sn-glycerol-3-phosphate acyltransferase/nucleoside-diphosphate-sugar epimerase